MKVLCTLFSFSLFLLSSLIVRAQRYFGVATGDYNTVNSMYLNPANLGGCNEKVAVNIFSVNVYADNNLGTISRLGDLGNNNTNAFTNSGNSEFSMLIPVVEFRGPAVIIGLNDDHKMTFALTTRIRGMNQFNHFSQTLYNTVSNPDHTSSDNYSYNTQKFNWTANVWSELGLSYGLVIFDDGQSQLRAGITLRYLGGIDYLGLKGNNIDGTVVSGTDSFYAAHSDVEFASNAINSNTAVSKGVNTSGIFGSFFGSGQGGGLGADIGVTYTYLIGSSGPGAKDAPSDVHRLSFSAAVTDIGAIKYKAGNNFVVNVTGNGYVTGKGLSDNIGNYTDFRNYAVSHGYTVDTGAKATKVYMPTAMLIGADYQVYGHIFVSATYVANVANRQNFGNSVYNQLTLTPRFDMKLLTVALPITYSALAHDMKFGLGFRIGGFFVGSDDMLALLSSNQHGVGVYLGGCVPIFRKQKPSTIN